MANTIPLDKMSTEEKLQAMESLWDDLCRKAGGVQSPEWHGEVLADREIRYQRGDDKAQDWESAKLGIRDKTK